MQIFEFSPLFTVILCITLWLIFQVSIAVLCMKINDKHFSSTSFLYRTRRWEKNGEIYEKIFKIRRWKKLLPDGGAIMKGGYKKRHIDITSTDNLEKFVIESCRGELAHLLSILPFWIFGFFAPARIILYMLIYAVFINFPCIIAQRYNRPRVIKLLEKARRRSETLK